MLLAIPARTSPAGSPSPPTIKFLSLWRATFSMLFKESACLILLAAPVVMAGQRPPVPFTPVMPVGRHNPPAQASRVEPPATSVRPVVRPVRSFPLPVGRPVSPAPVQQLTATNAIPTAALVQRPDPPLIVPAAPPAPSADPAGALAVAFTQGKLTIAAENVGLGRLLKLIGSKTGAEIECAPEIASEPVVARLGPGIPSEVLTALLTSPRIDFIVMGSDDQGLVQRVVVRRRASFGREPMASAPPVQPQAVNVAPEQSGSRETLQQEPEKQGQQSAQQ